MLVSVCLRVGAGLRGRASVGVCVYAPVALCGLGCVKPVCSALRLCTRWPGAKRRSSAFGLSSWWETT